MGFGINLYLVALMLGVAGRLGWTDIPEVLTRLDVMIVAGVLFVVEFFADKIPYVDNVWDAIHTVIRPLEAAAIGAVVAGDSASIGAAVGALVARPSPSTPTPRKHRQESWSMPRPNRSAT